MSNMEIEKKPSIQLQEIHSKSRVTTKSKGADFETAVATCGYGKFHYLLFLAVIPASWASVLDSSNMSMILPSAECDLNLSLFHKGILNGITYAGMVSSALFWGFIADVMGRRRILVYGFFADGVLSILCGLAQNFTTIVVFKYISGFIISGPYATIMTYCAEFYCTKDRPRVTLAVGFSCFAGCIVNAALAWILIPQNWYFEVGDKAFVYNSWRIYITTCGIPILLGALGLSFFPESPKFLMSQGRNEEALEVFKSMYALNNGESRDNYPIKVLEDELKDQRVKEEFVEDAENIVAPTKSLKTSISDGFRQMKPIFMRPYISRLLNNIPVVPRDEFEKAAANLPIILFNEYPSAFMHSANTLRLWQPQLFSTLNHHQNGTSGGFNLTFCEVLDNSEANSPIPVVLETNSTKISTCTVKSVDYSVYMMTLLVSITTNVCIFLAAVLVNIVGNKNLLIICFVCSTVAVLILNWASHYTLVIVLTSLFVGLMCTTTNLVISITVNLFPTSLRTMAVSLAMMVGRIGALSGNVTFPVLLQSGCFVAIVALAAILIVSTVLTIFIPKHKDNLK